MCVYMCVCVCVFERLHVCVCVHTFVRTLAGACTRDDAHVYACDAHVGSCGCTCMRARVCMYDYYIILLHVRA